MVQLDAGVGGVALERFANRGEGWLGVVLRRRAGVGLPGVAEAAVPVEERLLEALRRRRMCVGKVAASTRSKNSSPRAAWVVAGQ